MTKERLIELLSAISDDAVVKADFSYNRTYSNNTPAEISGLSFMLGADGGVSVFIEITEAKEPDSSCDVPF